MMFSPCVYIIGAPGTGKSTFMAELLDREVVHVGDFEIVHTSKDGGGSRRHLRGHRLTTYDGRPGLYLGQFREKHPGTDGLDRAAAPVCEDWLRTQTLPEFVVAEGILFSGSKLMRMFAVQTELLLVHLVAEDWVRDIRYLARGTTQGDSWVLGRVRSAAIRAEEIAALGSEVLTVDSADPAAWSNALERVAEHIKSSSSLSR